jgi:hypothetical protein
MFEMEAGIFRAEIVGISALGRSTGELSHESVGAGDRFRTDDLVLGKHALYQLSYTRPLLRD